MTQIKLCIELNVYNYKSILHINMSAHFFCMLLASQKLLSRAQVILNGSGTF